MCTGIEVVSMGLNLFGAASSYESGKDAERKERARIAAMSETAQTAIGSIQNQINQVVEWGDTRMDWANTTKVADIDLVGHAATKDISSVSTAIDATEVASGFAESGEIKELESSTIQDIYESVNKEYKQIGVQTSQEIDQIGYDTIQASNILENQIRQIESDFAGIAGESLSDYQGLYDPDNLTQPGLTPGQSWWGAGGYM